MLLAQPPNPLTVLQSACSEKVRRQIERGSICEGSSRPARYRRARRGNPTRIIVGGVPRLAGKTVAARQARFAAEWEHLRGAVVDEPRSGALTRWAVFVPAAHPDANIGVFFMEPFGYPDVGQ